MSSDATAKLLLEAAEWFPQKIVVVSPGLNILAANRACREQFPAATAGHRCYRVLYGIERPCDGCPVHKVLGNGHPALWHNQYGSLDPRRISCLYAYPLYDDDQRIKAIAMLDFDLTHIEDIEEELRRSNAFLRNLIFNAVDGIIATDMSPERKGRIHIFNDAASKVFGYDVHEAIHSLDIRDVYPGNGAHEVMRKLRSHDYGGRGKLHSQRVDIQRKDGEIIPISLNASIVYEHGREVATIGVFHDLRDTLAMAKELERTQLQLLQAEKMASLGKLAAGVAHQLNNPLSGITLFTQLILEEAEGLDAKTRADLERVLHDARRCSEIVKELLEFARQTRRRIQWCDVNQAITRTLFLLENQAIFQNITIEQALAPDLPQIQADLRQLNHMLMNIVLNAADAMQGSGTLRIATGPATGAPAIVITISDSGPGIDPAVLPHIFEPFYTTKEAGKGTGLGLSLVYGIAEDHGGRVTADSLPGHGATFRIELPIERHLDQGDDDGDTP